MEDPLIWLSRVPQLHEQLYRNEEQDLLTDADIAVKRGLPDAKGQ